MLFCDFCEIFKNTFFDKRPPMAAFYGKILAAGIDHFELYMLPN